MDAHTCKCAHVWAFWALKIGCPVSNRIIYKIVPTYNLIFKGLLAQKCDSELSVSKSMRVVDNYFNKQ